MFHFYSLHRAEFLQHYHKRSNIETTFHMIKSKFGQRLRSRTLTAQINEALCKVICHTHYNSVFKYLESEALTPVDSSGFSTGQFMRWLDVKYGTKEDRRMTKSDSIDLSGAATSHDEREYGVQGLQPLTPPTRQQFVDGE